MNGGIKVACATSLSQASETAIWQVSWEKTPWYLVAMRSVMLSRAPRIGPPVSIPLAVHDCLPVRW